MSRSRATFSRSRRVKAPSRRFSEHRHVGNDAPAFHHLEDAAAHDPVRIDAVDALAVEHDLAARDRAVLGLEQARNGLERRRLAGAVGAEQRHHGALRHVEAEPAQHQDHLVIDDLDVAHREQRLGRARPPPKASIAGVTPRREPGRSDGCGASLPSLPLGFARQLGRRHLLERDRAVLDQIVERRVGRDPRPSCDRGSRSASNGGRSRSRSTARRRLPCRPAPSPSSDRSPS